MRKEPWIDRVTSGDPTTLAEYSLACMRADNLAHKKYECEFDGLPVALQEEVWGEANEAPTVREK